MLLKDLGPLVFVLEPIEFAETTPDNPRKAELVIAAPVRAILCTSLVIL